MSEAKIPFLKEWIEKKNEVSGVKLMVPVGLTEEVCDFILGRLYSIEDNLKFISQKIEILSETQAGLEEVFEEMVGQVSKFEDRIDIIMAAIELKKKKKGEE